MAVQCWNGEDSVPLRTGYSQMLKLGQQKLSGCFLIDKPSMIHFALIVFQLTFSPILIIIDMSQTQMRRFEKGTMPRFMMRLSGLGRLTS